MATRRRSREAWLCATNTTRNSLIAALVTIIANLGKVPVSALQCFSCADCSVGGALSAHRQQCPPEETFCAAVSRRRIGRWGYHSSSVDRGCASSLDVACEQLDATSKTTPASAAATHAVGNHLHRREDDVQVLDRSSDPRGTSSDNSSRQPLCCSTDLCNGSEDARTEGHRRSDEHLRTLMEGNPRKKGGHSLDDNSAQSTRGGGVGGSRFSTVLVIVGTFSQVLWLVSRLIE